jgi:DNA invertase Pin-like site-specific DNA recombinase
MYCGRACQRTLRQIIEEKVKRRRAGIRRTDHRSVANYGSVRALDPTEIEELRRRRREGWRVQHLARAYGVTSRTIYRYLSAPPPVQVTVEGWRAWFVLSHRDRPLQVSAWERVA